MTLYIDTDQRKLIKFFEIFDVAISRWRIDPECRANLEDTGVYKTYTSLTNLTTKYLEDTGVEEKGSR